MLKFKIKSESNLVKCLVARLGGDVFLSRWLVSFEGARDVAESEGQSS